MNELAYYEKARELLSYCPQTGVMRWDSLRKGKALTSKNADGYLRVGITIEGKIMRMLVHRIAWFILHNEIPEFIDHPNRVRDDNREVNLRKCTKSQNAMNRKRNIKTVSGVRGITLANGKWLVRIQVDGKRVNLARLDSLDEAILVRDQAERQMFKEFRCGNS